MNPSLQCHVSRLQARQGASAAVLGALANSDLSTAPSCAFCMPCVAGTSNLLGPQTGCVCSAGQQSSSLWYLTSPGDLPAGWTSPRHRSCWPRSTLGASQQAPCRWAACRRYVNEWRTSPRGETTLQQSSRPCRCVCQAPNVCLETRQRLLTARAAQFLLILQLSTVRSPVGHILCQQCA